ncbi:hypothetical protein O7635_22435 [Asanoa sp. WMMD1127]|uniref:hypothetical protein n=1 Tax=Asanoa sp. WMMD1127 TaxID=3016107 RepID=UPI002417B3F6|nr:hypothetical protein [Asanoa sp. WMMD1127]MDG4824617.1 hypothetical protein [Asanoa sp. WMMD1127]
MIVERTPLPGIGVCHAVTTTRHQRIGVVLHHTGRRDVVLYDPDDPTRAAATVTLDGREAHHVADLLTGAVVVDHLTAPAPELTVCRIRVPAAYTGRPLPHDLPALVVIRSGRPVQDPIPRPGDELLVVATRPAVDALIHTVTGA